MHTNKIICNSLTKIIRGKEGNLLEKSFKNKVKKQRKKNKTAKFQRKKNRRRNK